MSEDVAVDHSSQFSLDFARKEGLRVVLPAKGELQIDIDSDAAFDQFQKAYDLLRRECVYDLRGFSVRPSRNGGEGRHITVRIHGDISPIERIALQTILGSDWKRELFSIARLKNGEAVPTLFFEKADDSESKPYPSINQQG